MDKRRGLLALIHYINLEYFVTNSNLLVYKRRDKDERLKWQKQLNFAQHVEIHSFHKIFHVHIVFSFEYFKIFLSGTYCV
jgi:hypothetical protein